MLLFDARIPADLLALSSLRRDVSARLASLAPTDQVKNAILLTISEMGANAINHGDPEPSYVDVRLRLDGASIVIEIEDDGGAFTGFERNLAQSLLRQQNLFAESGRGMSMIQSLLDDLSYRPGTPNRFTGRRLMGSSQPTILVVEDSAILLETYAAMLTRQYHVLKASSLDAAIALTRSERIDGIVTDLHLEGRRGSELIDILEADVERPPVPVLVITGDRSPESLERVMQSGVEQILPKPVSADAINGAVAAMLGRSARQNARLFRYFGGSIDQDGEDRVPPSVGPFDLKAVSARAGFGRGDFMCVLRREAGKRIVVADVMGHGLAAQLAGMRFKAAIRAIHGARPGDDVSSFLGAVSRALAREPVLPGSFLTMMVVDLFDDGRVELAGAGHPRAFALSDGAVVMIESDGPLPGMFEDAVYQAVALILGPGDRLFIPTDGLDPRAENAGLEIPAWLAAALKASEAMPFDAAIHAIDRQIRQVLTHSPVDDWTLLAIERGALAVDEIAQLALAGAA